MVRTNRVKQPSRLPGISPMTDRFMVSYERVTPESAEYGEAEEIILLGPLVMFLF